MNKQEQDIRKKSPVQIRNKKASFEYFFVDTYTAGMVLTGTEIKSIRAGKASLVDSYCVIDRGEIWVKGMNISPYFYGSFSNHEAKGDRKLLLKKREIRHLEAAAKDVARPYQSAARPRQSTARPRQSVALPNQSSPLPGQSAALPR